MSLKSKIVLPRMSPVALKPILPPLVCSLSFGTVCRRRRRRRQFDAGIILQTVLMMVMVMMMMMKGIVDVDISQFCRRNDFVVFDFDVVVLMIVCRPVGNVIRNHKGASNNDVTQIWAILPPPSIVTPFSTKALILSSQNP